MGETRIRDGASGVVVAGTSAARLHDIGGMWAERHEFVSPRRRQSQRPEIRYRLRTATRNLDAARLRELVAPLASRHGFTASDGQALLDRLLEIAGIDADTVAHRVAADARLAPRIAASYLAQLSAADVNRLAMSPAMQQSLSSIRETLAAGLHDAIGPTLESMGATLAKSSQVNEVAQKVAEQFITPEMMKTLSSAWAQSLAESSD